MSEDHEAPGAVSGRLSASPLQEVRKRAAALVNGGEFAAGRDYATRGLGRFPDDPYLLVSLGAALDRLGDHARAAEVFKDCNDSHPAHVQAWVGRGVALKNALAAGTRVAKMTVRRDADGKVVVEHAPLPEDASWKRQAEADVLACFARAHALDPQDALAASQLFHEKMQACDWDGLEALRGEIDRLTKAELAAGKVPQEHLFIHVSRSQDVAEMGEVARRQAAQIGRRSLGAKGRPTTHLPPPASHPERRLRIGYLSSDFNDHPVAHLMAGVYRRHDRGRFEIVALSHGKDDDSDYRRRAVSECDRFVDLKGRTDAEAVAAIRAERIDILVDLNGHTRESRMGLCAWRPAPVQVTYLGFPGTSGADYIDYVLTDRTVTPAEHLPHYSEAPVFLPHTYQANDAEQTADTAPQTRAAHGLPAGGVVFCSFNQPFKLEPEVFGIWMRLLAETEGSVLWLLMKSDAAAARLKREVEIRGIDPARLVTAKRVRKPQHLARFALADLALDTGTYNGHTTTSDALFAGVPVVTRIGGHFASRVSASLLQAAGLPQLITRDWDGYVRLARELAADADARAALRRHLDAARTTAPLFDTGLFVRDLEEAYRRMWARFRAGERPAAIDLAARN